MGAPAVSLRPLDDEFPAHHVHPARERELAMLRNLPQLPRVVWVVLAVTFFNRIGTMALPFLVLFLTTQRGLSAPAAGALLVAYAGGAVVAGPASGWLTSRFGARSVVATALLGAALATMAVPYVPNAAALTVIMAGWGLLAESFRAPTYFAIADGVAPEHQRQSFALQRLAVNLGMAVGSALGGVLWSFGPTMLFTVDAATSVCASAAALTFWPRAASNAPPRPAVVSIGGTASASHAPLMLFLTAIVLIGMMFHQATSSMSLWLVDRQGLSARSYGMLLALNGVIVVVLELPLAAALARSSARRSLAVGAALLGAGFGALAAASTYATAAVAVLIWTVGEIVAFPAATTRVAELAPPGQRAQYMGLYTGSWSAALGLGPWLGTISLHHFGERHWALVAATGLLAAALALCARPRAAARRLGTS